MTRTTRRILFYCAVILFLGVSYIVLLYAQGYKYNFSDSRFIRSGAIYVKTNTQAHVLLDGKDEATTSLLGNSASLGGLLPAAHTLSIQEAGYSSWQKKVVIKAGFVEDFTHVMLLPLTGQDKLNVEQEIRNLLYPPTPTPTPTPSASVTPKPTKTPKPSPSPSPTPDHSGPFYLEDKALYVRPDGGDFVRIAGNVVNAVISPDGNKVFWYSDGQIWVYWLSDTNYQPVHQAGDIALITRFNYPIKAAQWFRDSDHIALDAGLPGQGGLKVIEIDTRPGLNIINF